MTDNAPFVLVHGAWSSAAAWDDVVPRLEALGRRAIAIDLPGHGADATPLDEVTLADYGARVAAALGDGPPAILVGHSMGGMAISAAAEAAPERVAKLVYVAAFLPRDGESLVDLAKRQHRPTIRAAVRPGPTPKSTVLDPELAAPMLFQDASPAQMAAAIAGLGPQPNQPQLDRVTLTPDRFGRAPRAYVFCEADETVPIELQRDMTAASPCAETISLGCGHFPLMTAPDRLAAFLATL